MEIKYVGLDGLVLYDSEIKKFFKQLLSSSLTPSVINKTSSAVFPKTGNESCLYVDMSENKVYRWDNESKTYIVVGSNYDDMNIIDGGEL